MAAHSHADHGHRSHRDSFLPGICVSVSDSPAGSDLMAAQSGDSDRIHHLDNLRALAMLLGVSAWCIAYAKPSQLFWLATDRRC